MNNATNEKDFLIAELDREINGPDKSFISCWRLPEDDANGLYLPTFCHFEIVLSGVLPLQLPDQETPRHVHMAPGQVFYLSPGYGAWRAMDTERELLIVNLHPDGIECYRSHHYPEVSGQITGRISYHSSKSLTQGGLHVLKAFEFHSSESEQHELLMPLFRIILAEVKENLCRDHTGVNARAHFTYKMIRQYLNEKYDTAISRKTVAEEFGISPDYVSHLFQKFGAASFHDELTRLRLEQAVRCLRQQQMKLARISELCGFDEPGYFIKVFRRHFGTTPGEFRARLPLGK